MDVHYLKSEKKPNFCFCFCFCFFFSCFSKLNKKKNHPFFFNNSFFSSMKDNKLNITVHKARNIKQKTNYNVYTELSLSDAKGTKIGKPIETSSDKRAEPTWDFQTSL